MPLPGVSLAERTPTLEEFTAPTLDVLQATAQDAWHFSPTPAIFRIKELTDAQRGESPMLSQEDAMQMVGDLPLDIPEAGIKSDALEILVSRKKTELRRQSVLSRAEGGFAEGTARLTTGLVTSLFDPLNIASAFVPVVGQARYASMLARAGASVSARVAVRAKVGAIEGAVGAAMVEPIILSAATQEQADYDLMDSALNIAFGTVLGGGLHTSLGALSDKFRGVSAAVQKASPETRESAMRASTAQLMSGQKIEVSQLLEADPWYSYTLGRGIDKPTAADLDTKVSERLTELVRQSDAAEAAKISRGDRAQVEGRIANIEQELQNPAKVAKAMKQADPELAKQSNEAVKAQAVKKLEAEKAELMEQLRQADVATKQAAATRDGVEVAKERLAAGEALDPSDLPPQLREAVEQEIQQAKLVSGKRDLQEAVAAASKQGDYRNEWDYEPELDAHVQEQLKAAESRVDETAIDEDAAELDELLAEFDVDTKALDTVKTELDGDLAEAQSILERLKTCGRTAA